jgi:hypothetical protein
MGARLFAQSRLALFMALNSNQSAQCRFCDLVDVYYPCAGYLRHLPKKGRVSSLSTLLNRLM